MARLMPSLKFRVHAILQMEERGLTVEDIRMALGNGEDIESRPDDEPCLLYTSDAADE